MKIVATKAAEKDILSLEKNLGQRIADKITLLESNPYPMGSQKLSENKGYRIRIGDYRIIYSVNKKNKVITIIKIGHRREVYK